VDDHQLEVLAVEVPHLVLQVSAQEVVKVVHQERCNAVASVAALMGQKTVTAIVTAPLDLLPAVIVVKASQESVLQLAAGSVQLEWLLFVVEAVLRQEVVREATVPQLEADLVATDLLVEEVVQEAIARLVVAVDRVETDHHLQEGCLLQCLVGRME